MSPEAKPPIVQKITSPDQDLNRASEQHVGTRPEWLRKIYRRIGVVAVATVCLGAAIVPHADTIATVSRLGERDLETVMNHAPQFEFRQYSAEQAIVSTYNTYHLREGFYVDGIDAPSGFASAWSQYQLLNMLELASLARINTDVKIDSTSNQANAAIDTYWGSAPSGYPAGYNATKKYGLGTPDRYVDDNLWVARYKMNQYRQTGSQADIAKVKDIMTLFLSQRAANGAAYWKVQFATETNRDQCMVSNATAIPTLIDMYMHGFGDESYVTAAEQVYDWTNTLLDPVTGLYFDKVMTNGEIDKTIYTYGQAEMIDSLVALNQIDSARFPMSKAVDLARRALDYFSNRGGYGISKFDAIFLQSVMRLAFKTNDPDLIVDIHHAMKLVKSVMPESPTNLADAAGDTLILILISLPFSDWGKV